MQCPEAVSSVVLQIISIGIMNARASAWSGDCERCAIETDHVHNLPGLLLHYLPERLDYYWNIERPVFIAHLKGAPTGDLEALWQQLEPLVPRPKQHAPRLAI